MTTGKVAKREDFNKNGNSILNNAKYSSDNTDEWYTTYETIAEELAHYEGEFRDKTVLCNCDDPFESNFCYYFLRKLDNIFYISKSRQLILSFPEIIYFMIAL